MALDDLVACIERLKTRIQDQDSLLRQSEMLTRYVLIDPFLRALGWDTEDPTQVRPEYQHADYALFSGERPCVLLEAKKLDTPVSEGIEQSINYCLREGTRYFVVTNGRQWELYETHKPVPLAEKRILAFDLISDGSHEVALKALHLWRPNISASELTPAAIPVIGPIAAPPVPPEPAPPSRYNTTQR